MRKTKKKKFLSESRLVAVNMWGETNLEVIQRESLEAHSRILPDTGKSSTRNLTSLLPLMRSYDWVVYVHSHTLTNLIAPEYLIRPCLLCIHY